jgi:tetratricopeptide (TPR) repeat protein
MNRAERRRQEAARGQGHRAAVDGWLEQGRLHQREGRLVQAEAAYRQAFALAPQHAETLHLLGLVTYRLQRLPESLEYLSAAVERDASSPVYWFNFGVVLQKAGRPIDAAAAYQKAIALNSRYPEAYGNLGNVLREMGDLSGAVSAYQQALTLNPSQADTHNNLGVAKKELGLPQEAITCYRHAIALKPTHAEAYNNLGLALMEVGTLHDAVAAFQQALVLLPGYQSARYNLGIARSWAGDEAKACECLEQVARSRHDHGKPVAETAVYRSRIKHDAEQIDYLFRRNKLDERCTSYLQALQELSERLGRDASQANRLAIEARELALIAPSFNRILVCEPPARLEQGALNAALDADEVERRYHARRPEVTFIDGLLNDAALDALRRFCREATIWKKDYENGYCGAFLGDGFASPLLFQIADELRLKFPRIFKHHRLTQAWAFKHDSARRGLNIHADAAAVNVNFWITEDEANLNPSTGGLVVYDKEAPSDWNFKEYNSERNKPKILRWLEEAGAQAVTIPYRANRAVVFNSDLFHETDDVSFKDDYLSRRINITLLYGYRGHA